MIYFHNDYNQGCHPAVMEKLVQLQNQQMNGYGEDTCCQAAAEKIRTACKAADAAVHFLVGGTQTNLTVIAAALRPHQGVISADSGHINVHETGSIEATGHKVIQTPGEDGKVRPELVEQIVKSQSLSADAEHIVQPKMVYISNPTEYGTLYSLAELEELSRLCRAYRLYLFVDGARMGYGLAARENDITLADYARLCDAFYIGGTKCGAMFGEAVVISNPAIAEDFRYLIKQRGGMLAKGWLLGAQFDALFTDDLYMTVAARANGFADQIRQTLEDLGYPMYMPGCTNQVFVTLPDGLLEEIAKNFTYAVWEKQGKTHTTVRFCTSWATNQEQVDALCAQLRQK